MLSSVDVGNILHALQGEIENDVTVIGGGTAGFIAATAAARTGARTTLVEYMPFLSGTHGGAGLVLSATGFYHTYLGDRRFKYKDQLELLVKGLAFEYWNLLVRAGAAHGRENEAPLNIINDNELTKVVTERMVLESGADIWFMSQFVDALVDDGKLKGALVTRGGGLWLIKTKVLIDASGDGIAAAQAGASYELGRKSDGRPQPGSMFFEVGEVDIKKTLDHLKEHPDHFAETHYGFPPSADYLLKRLREGVPIRFKVSCGYDEAKAKGELPIAPGEKAVPPSLGSIYLHWKSGRVVPYMVSLNMDMVYGLDPADRDQYDEMLVETKRFVLQILGHYRRYVPGFEDCWLSRFPPMLGLREGRRIVGEYMLTEQDAEHGAMFEDAVGRCGAFIDVHGEEVGTMLEHREVGGEHGWFHIPYRSLIPKDVDNMLVAGKLVSADHVVHGSTRNMVICMMTGHAAGTAAALASRDNVSPRSLDVERLQQVLRQQDAII
ncbi:MAG: FAD-dependent oxidoreductase [Planctomycetes bacterium]|nr:FAD-dependent oxidoreductase [Planctomycetota bacterium]